jgi:ribonuclease BN (tRNA processing enzyme)
MGRDEPLEVYGPAGIKAMTDHILEAYKEDIRMRLYGTAVGRKRMGLNLPPRTGLLGFQGIPGPVKNLSRSAGASIS